MRYLFSDPEDDEDIENNQHYGEDSIYNGSDDEEGGDFNRSYNEGFYQVQEDHEDSDE